MSEINGKIIRVSGPVVDAEGLRGVKMYEVCRVGDEGLIGEVNKVSGDVCTIQVYEETAGIKPGEAVIATGRPLSVELGPGLIGQIFDGIQRPLPRIKEAVGDFIRRGVVTEALPRDTEWHFIPLLRKSEKVEPGTPVGEIPETKLVTHRIIVPYGMSGELVEVADEGKYKLVDTIATVKSADGGENKIALLQTWPVRRARPIKFKLSTDTPLVTGQRIIDTFFPTAKGGTAAIPGGFGTGKTVMLHQLAKWADAKIIIYVGCGERGNEMTEVLEEFPKLTDPRSGEPLMARTVLIANTSNMPVAAREASIYTGITMAEYFRDMGYDVALMADSTSRWAEALREISGRLEEMPGEEGYPAYLASRLSEFYERAGRVVILGPKERIGSISVTGAVSPPGGDFSEPVTVNTLRIVKVFWALDKDLASRRHFPAINWLQSYSLYQDNLREWFEAKVSPEWASIRETAMTLLQREEELKEIVQLVGPDALPETEKVILEAARMIREDYLMQSALHPVDSYCDPTKSYRLLRAVIKFYENMKRAVNLGAPIREVLKLGTYDEIARLKIVEQSKIKEVFDEVEKRMDQQFESLLSKSTSSIAATA
ncbi:MAG: V-type ATP synthase subunit A [Candidatus Atabeyarchaeum deiterrae]